jgi:imidazolonepropionase-like amidohydrolase
MSRATLPRRELFVSLGGVFALGTLASLGVPGAARAQPAPTPRPAPSDKTPGKGASPAPQRVVIVGGKVHTQGSKGTLEGADVVLEGGLVSLVGPGQSPEGALRIDARGKVVTPGLVDVLTGLGLVEIELEKSARDEEELGGDRVRAAFRAADGYDPASTLIPIARAGGLTSAGVVPTGGLVSGQSAFVDLGGVTAREAMVREVLALHVRLGGPGPATSLLKLREALDDARAFDKNRAGYEKNQSRSLSASRLDLEALVLALRGTVPTVFHADRASDLLACLAVAKQFGLRPIVAGAAEGWKVAAELAQARAGVVVQPLVNGPESFRTIFARDDNAARLARAGVRVAISTGSAHDARKLRQLAGNAVRGGLAWADALRAITHTPAELFGLASRQGTLEPGRVANVVVWSADPLETSSHAEQVFVRGVPAPRDTRQERLLERYRRMFG